MRLGYQAGALSEHANRPSEDAHPEIFLGSSSVVTSLVAISGPLAEVTATMSEDRQGVHETVDVVLLFSE